jgi:uncharacterized protein (DUF2147 family)
MKTSYAITITITGALLLGPSTIAHPAPEFAPETGALGVKESEDAIVGEWIPEEKDGRIRFVKAPDGTYTGISSWGAHPRKDSNNPDPKLRDRSTIGIVIIWNLKYEDGEYVDGYCYNPNDGKTYRMKTQLLGPDTLKVRGYLAIPLLGQTQQWTRYH